MHHIPQDDAIQLSISIYKNIGESMNDSSTTLHLYRSINISIMIINLIAILANLFHVNGGLYVKTIEGSLTVIHALLKYILFLYYKSDIKILLSDMLNFWKVHENSDEELNKNIGSIFKYLKLAQNWFLATSVFVVTVLFLRPALSSETKYIFYCWVPNSIVLETIALLCQYYFMAILISITFSYDSMYISYSTHVIVQLKLLKHRLKHIDVKRNIGQVYTCIQHHQFILSIFGRMNQVYFWMFLFHYFVTLTTGCTQLYVILRGNSDFIDLVATTSYIAALFVQFGYWSFPVEEIVFELSNISTAIYLSTWYRENRTVTRILLTMMIKAQRQRYMSAGGLMDMNIDAFGSVVRKIFSFYALIRNILNK